MICTKNSNRTMFQMHPPSCPTWELLEAPVNRMRLPPRSWTFPERPVLVMQTLGIFTCLPFYALYHYNRCTYLPVSLIQFTFGPREPLAPPFFLVPWHTSFFRLPLITLCILLHQPDHWSVKIYQQPNESWALMKIKWFYLCTKCVQMNIKMHKSNQIKT